MTMIGQYEVRALLGEGGIGQVHAAFDTVLEREVALKSLRPELVSDKGFVDRFRGEAKSLALLNHPNITTLYSVHADGAKLSMVMELVRGDTLDALLKKRGGPLPVREALAIVAQATEGLSYAHSMGVIHRDIKPANLMVTPAGMVKIMDFGIARVRGSQRLTRDGSMVGTLAYMAPEQLRGEPGDERSDLYSLAIVLYEMLCGNAPFAANSDYDLMQKQISERPVRLLGRVPDLDAKVESALMRALAKKPEERFASVHAFSDALGAASLRIEAPKIVLDGTRLIGRPPIEIAPPKSRTGPFAVAPAFGWKTAAVAGVVVVGLLAGGGFVWFRSTGAASQPQARAAPPPAQARMGEQQSAARSVKPEPGVAASQPAPPS